MKSVETLTIEEAEKLRKKGMLKHISSEKVPQRYRTLFESYLQKRAEQLMTDVLGIPNNIGEEYNFYRTNLAQVITMPQPNKKQYKKAA
jgi:hypothetical protein